MHIECIECGKKYDVAYVLNTCSCDGLLEIKYDFSNIDFKIETMTHIAPKVWRYRDLLPIKVSPVTLFEGGTPLYKCDKLGESLGLKELYVKHEGMNPTGSFKDRGMTIGVSRALELGMKTVACASTGNTSASMADLRSKGRNNSIGSAAQWARRVGEDRPSAYARCKGALDTWKFR